MAQPIAGDRDLSPKEIEIVNWMKRLAESVREALERAKQEIPDHDPRWAAVGTTDLQKGFMSFIRSITRPQTF